MAKLNFSVADIPCMGVGGLVDDGDLFEPVVAMETEQEGYDIKGLTDHMYNTCTQNKNMHVVCMNQSLVMITLSQM